MTNDEIERFVEHIARAIARDPQLIGNLISRIDSLMAGSGTMEDAGGSLCWRCSH
jgi:hypothetical protein